MHGSSFKTEVGIAQGDSPSAVLFIFYLAKSLTFVSFVDLLLFSSFSDIPGAFRIKTCDKSRIKT